MPRYLVLIGCWSVDVLCLFRDQCDTLLVVGLHANGLGILNSSETFVLVFRQAI